MNVWKLLEQTIQESSVKKDANFVLKGKWKKSVGYYNGYKIFKVDGDWIRNNLCCYFGHGGHGMVHEFIPTDEVWVSSHHPYSKKGTELSNCDCKLKHKGQKLSNSFFISTALHEIHEIEKMKQGIEFCAAHQSALSYEREMGLLNDPYNDVDTDSLIEGMSTKTAILYSLKSLGGRNR